MAECIDRHHKQIKGKRSKYGGHVSVQAHRHVAVHHGQRPRRKDRHDLAGEQDVECVRHEKAIHADVASTEQEDE